MKSSKTHTTVATATALAAHLFCSGERQSRALRNSTFSNVSPTAATIWTIAGGAFSNTCDSASRSAKIAVGFERARAEREELRIRRECHDLVKRSDFEEGIDAVAYVVLKHLAHTV